MSHRGKPGLEFSKKLPKEEKKKKTNLYRDSNKKKSSLVFSIVYPWSNQTVIPRNIKRCTGYLKM